MLRLYSHCPPESSQRLINPERGLYAIVKLELSDDVQDVEGMVEGLFTPEQDDLLLCEINLRRFTAKPLSDCALRQAESFLNALRKRGGSLILRFLYDWDGRGMASEPNSRERITEHMRQLGPAVRAHADRVFLHQGLFIGSWGEMHGTRYSSKEDLRVLLSALRGAIGPEVTIAMRTMEQRHALEDQPGGRRLSLYNDGIMGSVSDLGSYPVSDIEKDREKALRAQEQLCLRVPNGGEVIYNPAYSGFTQAAETLRRMRVSYLNRFHDVRALRDWASDRCMEPGLWQGMDGLDYMERHLGYRYVLQDVRLGRSITGQALKVRVRLGNVGFAPAYQPLTPRLILVGEDGERTVPMRWAASVPDAWREIVAATQLQIRELPRGKGKLRFCLWSEKYRREILLGSEGHEGTGYCIGGFEAK